MNLLLFLTSISTLFSAPPAKPAWVTARPVDTIFYIGIASAPIAPDSSHVAAVKAKASAAVASEIAAAVTAGTRKNQQDTGEAWLKDYLAEVQAEALANLKGLERAGEWRDKKEYWVYYRLPKQAYRLSQWARRHAALEKAEAFRQSAIAARTGGDAAKSLRSLLLAYQEAAAAEQIWVGADASVPDSAMDTLEAKVGTPQMEFQLRRLLGQIRFIARGGVQDGAQGQGLKVPVVLSIRFGADSAIERPAPGFPVLFEFIEGAGEVSPKAVTDSLGIAKSPVAMISSSKSHQVIRAGVDFQKILGQEEFSPDLGRLIHGLPAPATYFEIIVGLRKAFLIAEENNLGKPLKANVLEPLLRREFAGHGFRFVEDTASAETLFLLKANSREGALMNKMRIVSVDLTFIIKGKGKEPESFKHSAVGIQGAHPDAERAGLLAYEKAAGVMGKEVIPQALKALGQGKK